MQKDEAISLLADFLEVSQTEEPILRALFDSFLLYIRNKFGIVLFDQVQITEEVHEYTSYRPVTSASIPLKDAWNGYAGFDEPATLTYQAGIIDVPEGITAVLFFATASLWRKLRFERDAIARISDASGMVNFAPPPLEKWVPDYVIDYIHSIFPPVTRS